MGSVGSVGSDGSVGYVGSVGNVDNLNYIQISELLNTCNDEQYSHCGKEYRRKLSDGETQDSLHRSSNCSLESDKLVLPYHATQTEQY